MFKRKIFSVLLIFILVLSGCGQTVYAPSFGADESKKLVVYTAHKEEIYGPIVREFEDRTGIMVDVVTGGTNELLSKISEESDSPKCDVMFGGGVDSLSAYTDLFYGYECSVSDKLFDDYRQKDDKYTVFSTFPIVFIYNRKLVYSAGTPRTWHELLNNHWAGQIAFADPSKSGSAYTSLCTLIEITGDKYDRDEAIRLFAKNLKGELSSGSSKAVEDVVSGSKLIGITTEDIAKKYIMQGAQIGIVYPEDGTSLLPDGTAIVNGAPHLDNAILFLEFTVSDDVQNLLQDYCYRHSVRKDINVKSNVSAIEYDILWAEENRKEIIDRLNETIGGEK